MKAYVIDNFNGIDAVHQADIPKPEPQENELLVQIAYASVNPIDWKTTEGYLKEICPCEFPVILGWDASGTVIKGVGNFKEGDAVFFHNWKGVVHDGTFAEYIALDPHGVAPAPKSIGLNEAAAVPLAALTAWQALFDVAELKKGETVLIHAGAGGVGGFAIQFAHYIGAHVITTASSKNHDYVKKLGADQAIDYRKEDFTRVKADVVLDCVGGETFDRSVYALVPGGRLITIAKRSDKTFPNITTAFHFVQPNGEQLDAIGKLIDAGIVSVPEITEMPLDQVKETLHLSKERHVSGKIVLKIV